MKRLLAATVLLVSLAACGRSGGENVTSGTRLSDVRMKLTDGRTVTCVLYHAGHKGGISCDWENASVTDE